MPAREIPSCLLQPCGGVDHVARNEALALRRPRVKSHDRLARVDGRPHREPQPGIGLVQLVDRLEDAKAGADSPLGIVLVRDRSAEGGHHRVAHELLDDAAEALDLLLQTPVIGTETRTNVLRVGAVRTCRKADQVDEEDRDDLAFLLGRSSRGEQPAAPQAEPRPLRVLLPALGTRLHEQAYGGPASATRGASRSDDEEGRPGRCNRAANVLWRGSLRQLCRGRKDHFCGRIRSSWPVGTPNISAAAPWLIAIDALP